MANVSPPDDMISDTPGILDKPPSNNKRAAIIPMKADKPNAPVTAALIGIKLTTLITADNASINTDSEAAISKVFAIGNPANIYNAAAITPIATVMTISVLIAPVTLLLAFSTNANIAISIDKANTGAINFVGLINDKAVHIPPVL